MEGDCFNSLKIEGDEQDIERFKEQAAYVYDERNDVKTSLSFNQFIPLPPELSVRIENNDETSSRLIAKYGCDNGFDWVINNWGVEVEAFADDPIGNVYEFITEWNPPIKWIINVSRKFPGLIFILNYQNFSYPDEDLADFGSLVIQNGKKKSEEYKTKGRCVRCSSCNRVTGYLPDSLCKSAE